MLKIVVIGGGICGFTCAVKIKEYFQEKAHVTVFSDKFSPHTTGDISAGFWGPSSIGKTNQSDVMRWSKHTHDFLHELWLSKDRQEAGVCLLPCIRVTTDPNGLKTYWKDTVFDFKKWGAEELEHFNRDKKKQFTDGCHYYTFTSEPTKLLPYLMKRFRNAGGIITFQKVNSLKEFARNTDFDIIVNCTGLGARELVPDKLMYPIRGQVIRVYAPWIRTMISDDSDDRNYIIPNSESVVLGGTHQANDYNLTPDRTDREHILNGCMNLEPRLAGAREIREMVGLRPGRDSVRLEKEETDNGKVIIHNYGHGGSGVTLSWGCAEDVLKLVQNRIKSKL